MSNFSDFFEPSGKIIQVVNVKDGEVANSSTQIPSDDTIPQNTEGSEIMTLAITPSNSLNKLRVQAVIYVGASNSVARTCALFQDSTAGALSAANSGANNADGIRLLLIDHYMAAGTTSSTTFKIRIGLSSTGTITFNGDSSSRIFAGVMSSSMTITEIGV
jgi:hypothetical protein